MNSVGIQSVCIGHFHDLADENADTTWSINLDLELNQVLKVVDGRNETKNR